MNWLYLSPHLDDAVYSCGGLIAAQVQAGQHVRILTVCAGDPPDAHFSPLAQTLHARWGTDGFATAAIRREEDRRACESLGAVWQHADVPDCIYRRSPRGEPLYTSDEALFGAPAPQEAALLSRICDLLRTAQAEATRLVVPLTLGGHVDHRLVRAAAAGLGCPLWFYADYPYARHAIAGEVFALLPAGARLHRFALDETHIRQGCAAMACYASQLTTFWTDETALQNEMHAWTARLGGALLWETSSVGN
ncbi:MAG: PIG-L family deacetylase [Anaerolineales bacterium]